jgi:hypothetical protein
MNSNLWITPDELGDLGYTEYAEEAAQVASNLLWAMSGRKYTGVTTVTEKYTCTLRNNRMGPSEKTNSPMLFGGDVYNIPSSDFDEYSELLADGLSPDGRIKLRGRPVSEVLALRDANGEILDPSGYYLVDHSTLHIRAGTPWTPCNVEITYTYGTAVPTAGKMAARKLALEFARLWSGDETCELPQRVTSVSRQGVSYTILDNQDFIQELRTGLYEIDLFLKVVNPDNARRKSKVFSPDKPRARRYTPKPFALPLSEGYDLTNVRDAPSTWTSVGKTVDLSNLFAGTGWDPLVTVGNYSGSRTVNLDEESISLDSIENSLSFSVPYKKANNALGLVDPGTWTLYATKTIGGVENLAEIASGNIQVRMY